MASFHSCLQWDLFVSCLKELHPGTGALHRAGLVVGMWVLSPWQSVRSLRGEVRVVWHSQYINFQSCSSSECFCKCWIVCGTVRNASQLLLSFLSSPSFLGLSLWSRSLKLSYCVRGGSLALQSPCGLPWPPEWAPVLGSFHFYRKHVCNQWKYTCKMSGVFWYGWGFWHRTPLLLGPNLTDFTL